MPCVHHVAILVGVVSAGHVEFGEIVELAPEGICDIDSELEVSEECESVLESSVEPRVCVAEIDKVVLVEGAVPVDVVVARSSEIGGVIGLGQD